MVYDENGIIVEYKEEPTTYAERGVESTSNEGYKDKEDTKKDNDPLPKEVSKPTKEHETAQKLIEFKGDPDCAVFTDDEENDNTPLIVFNNEGGFKVKSIANVKPIAKEEPIAKQADTTMIDATNKVDNGLRHEMEKLHKMHNYLILEIQKETMEEFDTLEQELQEAKERSLKRFKKLNKQIDESKASFNDIFKGV